MESGTLNLIFIYLDAVFMYGCPSVFQILANTNVLVLFQEKINANRISETLHPCIRWIVECTHGVPAPSLGPTDSVVRLVSPFGMCVSEEPTAFVLGVSRTGGEGGGKPSDPKALSGLPSLLQLCLLGRESLVGSAGQ